MVLVDFIDVTDTGGGTKVVLVDFIDVTGARGGGTRCY